MLNGIPNCYFKCQPHKMVKHTQTSRRVLPTNCLSVFDHFVGRVLKELFCIYHTPSVNKERKKNTPLNLFINSLSLMFA